MKNEKQHGHTAHNGNKPAPYTKYKKKPFRYEGLTNLQWETWRNEQVRLFGRNVLGRKVQHETAL